MQVRIATLGAALLLTLPLRAADVEGFVYDSAGRAVTGARVSLHEFERREARAARWSSASPERQPLIAAGKPMAVLTSESGRFAFAGTPDSLLQAVVSAHGFAPSAQVVLPGERVTVTLHGAPSVDGQVVSDGKTVAGATVIWMRGDEVESVSQTDAAGRYSVPDPARWASNVAVFHPDYAPRYSPNDRGDQRTHSIVLERPARIEGIALDAAGRAVPNAVISIDGLRAGTSAAEGTFTTTRFSRAVGRMTATAGDLFGVGRLNDKGAWEIRLAPARFIEGVVRLRSPGAGAAPLAGVPLLIQDVSGEMREQKLVVTDAKGRYTSGPLAPGRYSVSVTGGVEGKLRADYSDRMFAEETGPEMVDLRKAERAGHDITLFRPAMIRGRVTDSEGQPVAGAAVAVMPAGEPSFHMGHEIMAPRTGADGRYELPLLWTEGPQKLEIRVMRSGHSVGRSEPFALAKDSEMRVDVRLPAETAVRLRIVGRDGRPLAGARAAFSQFDETTSHRIPPDSLLHREAHGLLESGPDGEIALRLQPGEYDFAARAAGHQPRTSEGHTIGSNPSTVTLTLEPGVAISGRIVRGGTPVAGVQVILPELGRDMPVMTEADGLFSIDSLAPGDYELVFLKHEEMIEERRRVTAPATSLRIELPPAASLSGTVVDAASGAPVQRFMMEVQHASLSSRGRMLNRGASGPDGTFEFAALPAGDLQLIVAAEGYVPSQPLQVRLEPGTAKKGLRIALDRGATVSGRVIDERGNPVAGARIHIHPRQEREQLRSRIRMVQSTAETAEDGTFSLSGLIPGPTTIAVNRQGFVAVRKEVDVAGQSAVEIQLSRGLSVSGTVRAQGRPLEGAMVGAATAAAGAEHQSATTDANGRFTLEGLVPALYTISAFKDGYGHREMQGIDATTQSNVTIDLDQRQKAVIHGRVIGMPEGAPGEKVTMRRVHAFGSEGGGEAAIDSTGFYRIEDVPSGLLRVTAHVSTSGGSRTSPEKVVEVAPGSETRVDLEFADVVTVSGRVTQEGRALPRASVVFTGANGSSASAITDESGRYSIPLPQRGAYQVYVHARGGDSGRYQAAHTITESRTLDIDLRQMEIRGVVIDAATRAPIPEAFISLFLGGSAGSGGVSPRPETTAHQMITEAATDRSGRFLIQAPTSGTYEIVASARGYAQQMRTLNPGAAAAEQVIELTPAEALLVRVIDGIRGTPLEAHVVVRDEHGRMAPARGERIGDGRFSYSLRPGRYSLTAVVHGYAQRTVTTTAPGAVEIAVAPGGNVLFESSVPLEGTVRIREASGVEILPCCESAAWPLTGTRTLVQQLMPGQYVAEFTDFRGSLIARAGFTVAAGQTTRVQVK